MRLIHIYIVSRIAIAPKPTSQEESRAACHEICEVSIFAVNLTEIKFVFVITPKARASRTPPQAAPRRVLSFCDGVNFFSRDDYDDDEDDDDCLLAAAAAAGGEKKLDSLWQPVFGPAIY